MLKLGVTTEMFIGSHDTGVARDERRRAGALELRPRHTCRTAAEAARYDDVTSLADGRGPPHSYAFSHGQILGSMARLRIRQGRFTDVSIAAARRTARCRKSQTSWVPGPGLAAHRTSRRRWRTDRFGQ